MGTDGKSPPRSKGRINIWVEEAIHVVVGANPGVHKLKFSTTFDHQHGRMLPVFQLYPFGLLNQRRDTESKSL